MPAFKILPTLFCVALVIPMPTSCHPRVGPCRTVQRMAFCGHLQLAAVPRNLPENVEELNINSNLIRKLPDGSLSNYPLLQTLNCGQNHIERVDIDVFKDSPLLENLNLAENNLSIDYEYTAQSMRFLSRLRTLDLSGNFITEDMASELLKNLTSLEYLSLSRNLLSRLDNSIFSALHQLKELNLERNMLYEIDGAFDHLKKLHRLNLAFNYLPCLVKFEMTQLVVLNASHNFIEWFISNPDMEEDFQLETLDLSDNKLYFFPFLPSHSRLRNLLLSQNQIRFYNLTNITTPNWTTTVDFYNLGNNVSNVTAQLWDEIQGDISSIEMLDMSSNLLVNLPSGFLQKMPNLHHLRLRTNCLESVNLSTGELPVTLYELDMSNNRVTELHADQGTDKELNNLTHLNLSLNNIQKLPSRIFSGLPSISMVDLSYNTLGLCQPGQESSLAYSDCVFWKNIVSLRQLHLAGCNLVELPPSSFEGTPLTVLELSNNENLRLRQDSLTSLSRTLQHLGLGNTNLQDLDLSPFQQLRSLDISKNSISQLPKSLLSLNLRRLDLRDNKLTTISSTQADSLGNKLLSVFVKGNAFNCCQLGWFWTFQKAGVQIEDQADVTCVDQTQRITHNVVHFSKHLCVDSDEESIWWCALYWGQYQETTVLNVASISTFCGYKNLVLSVSHSTFISQTVMNTQRHLAMARLRVGGRQSDVAHELDVSQSIFSRLASRHRTTGRVPDRPGSGAP
ncbi:transforming growth factor beta activator LRRC33 isoform X3 [Denticeps clupeoides]|uniref:transforming growth factor beta activator LRRC33 isoform X3 n=2 Tax=Denticeps clupeoides TaxID=299321 RepID=UPI0010A4610F|nr:transforming growth factor beta activator LRRC33 isoform X3 [Denticeps clupeoides]